MSKISDANTARDNFARARDWRSMLGRQYHGGGGGYGQVRQVNVEAKIYFQESDGSKNYHEAPDTMRIALAAVIARRFKELADEALADLAAAHKAAALEAVAEYAALMREAGIEVPGGAA